MKVLVATDKPFAKVAVDGIRKEIEAAGYELALLEKYGDKAKLLEAVKDANAIIIRSDIIDAEVLDAAKELKIVVRAGAPHRNSSRECPEPSGCRYAPPAMQNVYTAVWYTAFQTDR